VTGLPSGEFSTADDQRQFIAIYFQAAGPILADAIGPHELDRHVTGTVVGDVADRVWPILRIERLAAIGLPNRARDESPGPTISSLAAGARVAGLARMPLPLPLWQTPNKEAMPAQNPFLSRA
jgi:hypothetical protein